MNLVKLHTSAEPHGDHEINFFSYLALLKSFSISLCGKMTMQPTKTERVRSACHVWEDCERRKGRAQG